MYRIDLGRHQHDVNVSNITPDERGLISRLLLDISIEYIGNNVLGVRRMLIGLKKTQTHHKKVSLLWLIHL